MNTSDIAKDFVLNSKVGDVFVNSCPLGVSRTNTKPTRSDRK